jgi:hypothetical protein
VRSDSVSRFISRNEKAFIEILHMIDTTG